MNIATTYTTAAAIQERRATIERIDDTIGEQNEAGAAIRATIAAAEQADANARAALGEALAAHALGEVGDDALAPYKAALKAAADALARANKGRDAAENFALASKCLRHRIDAERAGLLPLLAQRETELTQAAIEARAVAVDRMVAAAAAFTDALVEGVAHDLFISSGLRAAPQVIRNFHTTTLPAVEGYRPFDRDVIGDMTQRQEQLSKQFVAARG